MKIVLFIFLATLLAASHAVTLKAKSKAVLKALSENLENPSFKTVFKNLLELTAADEYDTVAEIFTQVRSEIAGDLTNVQQDLANQENSYNEQLTNYQGSIEALDQSLGTVKQEQVLNTGRRDDLQELIKNTQVSISNAVNARDERQQRRQETSDSNAQKRKDLNEAISDSQQTIDILQQVEEQDLQENSLTLLQVRNKRLQTNLQLIQKKTQNIKTTSTATSFVEALIKIAQSGINQGDIDQIVSLLVALKSSFQEQLQNIDDDDQADQQDAQSFSESQESTIKTQQTLLDNSQSDLTSLTALIDTQTNRADSLQASIENFSSLVNELNESHGSIIGPINDLIERLQKDIESIDQALQFITSQQS